MNETTIQGQAWDQLAKKRYGTEKQMGIILPVNPDEADALLFAGNLSITMPDVTPARVKSLPPWERM